MPKTMKIPQLESIKNRDEARDLAIQWQHWMADRDMSIDELHEWQCFFEQLGHKFDLTEEFQENAIC